MPASRLLVLLIGLLANEGRAQGREGVLTGLVNDPMGAPVADAVIDLRRDDQREPRSARSDAEGRFRIAGLSSGSYDLQVRRLGFRNGALNGIRITPGRVTDVRIVLTQSATQLSTITIVVSPTQVDVTSPALVQRFTAETAVLLPTARDAASLINLVPGARRGAVWGGAGDLANNFQLDGISVNHPGVGGDFLAPSIDWIEALEVRGLGASAESGNFQGGLINAVTKSGGAVRKGAFRVNLEAPSLTASNFNLREEGVEQAGRREASGEIGGPLIKDRLFYFVAGQFVARELRVPDLTTNNFGSALDYSAGFREPQTEQRDLRGFGKLTWRPNDRARLDAILGAGSSQTERFGLTGVDDPAATRRVRAPSAFYELAWVQQIGTRHSFDLRMAGFTATERRDGYAGADVPGVQVFSLAREPGYQNANFNERRDPSSLGLNGKWTTTGRFLGASHKLVGGFELSGGRWEHQLARNGGMTWRPFPSIIDRAITPLDPRTWAATGSQWGGEMLLRADVRNDALYVQDEISLGSRVTLSPGIRWGQWSGTLRSRDGADPSVAATGWDPRLGLAWDVLGNGTMAFKAHWGRYHQGMTASLFDRIAGADVYQNERFYLTGPVVTDPKKTYTVAERDALFIGPTGVPFQFTDKYFDETGRVENYRQPYVDQMVFALERSFGSRWKVEGVYTSRRNRDFVGLVDRNIATNYTPVAGMWPDQRYGVASIIDANGNLLQLPVVYLSSKDLREVLIKLRERRDQPPPGFSFDTIPSLRWEPDRVFTTIPDARRAFDQGYLAVRTEQPRWNALGSITWTRLVGNVAGVTTSGGIGNGFSAGAWSRPNEAINMEGRLPNASEVEAKLWASAKLRWGIEGGLTVTHVTGERFTPAFEVEGHRYRFRTSLLGGRDYEGDLFRLLNGQQILLEPRGSRGYADRTILDLHVERRFAFWKQSWLFTVDLFNALANAEATMVKTQVDDQFLSDPTTLYGAIRQRVAPRSLRLGSRVEF